MVYEYCSTDIMLAVLHTVDCVLRTQIQHNNLSATNSCTDIPELLFRVSPSNDLKLQSSLFETKELTFYNTVN